MTIGSRRSFSISHSTVMLFGPSVHSLTEYYHIHIYNNIFMKKMSRMILQLDNVDNFTIFYDGLDPFSHTIQFLRGKLNLPSSF